MSTSDPVSPPGALRRWSPLVANHQEATRLVPPARLQHLNRLRSLLFGRHLTRFPLMALTVSQDMGPARHAVTQRTVAGTVTFITPVPQRVPPAS